MISAAPVRPKICRACGAAVVALSDDRLCIACNARLRR